MNELKETWWGNYSLSTGATAQWRIGPLQLTLQRKTNEWIVEHQEVEIAEDDRGWHFDYVDQDLEDNESSELIRLVFKDTPKQVTILPALADRPVVSRPYTRFTVPASERATIFVSTPLWFVLASDDQGQSLMEFPIQRPSDTWFGPSTLEGETCYAIRTHSRLNLENLTLHPYRALTQIDIDNRSETPLHVERLNLPVPYLSLFVNPEGILWTEAVTMTQKDDGSLAEFEIQGGPPALTGGAELLSPARKMPQKNMLIRAFGMLAK